MTWPILSIIASLFEGMGLSVERRTLIREHAMEFTAAMLLFAMLFTTPIWLLVNTGAITLYQVGMTLVSALSMSLGLYFFARALRHMAAPYTNPFLSLGPVVVALLAYFALGEPLTNLQLGAIMLIFVGSYTLYSHSHHSIFEPLKKAAMIPHLKHVLYGIFFASLAAVLDKKMVGPEHSGMGVLPYMALLFFFSGVILIIMMLLLHDGFKGIGNGMRNNTMWLSIVAAMAILSKGMILWALSMPGVLVSLVFSVKQLSLVITLAFSGDLLHRDNFARKASGVVIMLAGAALLLL